MAHSTQQTTSAHPDAESHFVHPASTLDGCPCPYCDVPPRIGDLLPGVLAEMRRREASSRVHMELVYSGCIPSPLRKSLDEIAPGRSDWRYLYLVGSKRDGALLYIGQTWSPAARLFAHRNNQSQWWDRRNHLMLLRHQFEGWGANVDEEIVDIERAAILELNPAHNIARTAPRRLLTAGGTN